MPLSYKREVIFVSILAAFIAILYRYWLILPVLEYLTIGQWRLVALLIAATIGVLMSRLKLSLLAVVCSSTVGLLLGGTWAAHFGEDIPISVAFAFASSMTFWRDEIVLIVASLIGWYCTARLF